MGFLDKGAKRKITGTPMGKVVFFASIALALYSIAATVYLYPDQIMYRGIFVSSLVALVMIRYTTPGAKNKDIKIVDYVLAVLALGVGIFVIINTYRYANFTWNVHEVLLIDQIVGWIAILLVLEACRRAVGYPLMIIAILMIAYAFFGEYLSGLFRHRGNDSPKVIYGLFMGTNGIFGESIGIASSYVLMFVVFGEFLNATGGGDFFFDLSRSIAGSSRGGLAKTAVVASALFGSISGSPISNVATTGAMTIPMMKRSGYPAYFAGAVETAASCGGTIMPPVMGAVAFLMAELLGINYSDVLIAAIIPALLYYLAVFMAVDFEALRMKLKGENKEDLPNAGKTLIKGIQYLFPLIWLVVRLFQAASPSRCAVESIIAMIVIAVITQLVKRDTKYPISFKGLANALVNSMNSLMPVAIACAAAGIVIGVIQLTGIAGKFTSLIMSMGQGLALPALLLTMLVTVILGMGMSISPTYLLAASLAAPGLIDIGINPIAAHLFIVYFAAMATMTPPVSLAAYTAAGIAEADPIKVGFTGVRIGIVAFIIPYVFVFQPHMILQMENREVWDVALTVIFTFLGVLSLTMGINRWSVRQLNIVEIVPFLGAALLMFIPNYWLNAAGLVVAAFCLFYTVKTKNKKASAQSA